MPSAEGLPEELIKLFKPLCCDLCSTKLNSPSSARLHYESKNHEKKINSWLATWSEQTGTPIPKRQAVSFQCFQSVFFYLLNIINTENILNLFVN